MNSKLKDLSQHFDREYILPLQAYADFVYKRPTRARIDDVFEEYKKLLFLFGQYKDQIGHMFKVLTEDDIKEITGLVNVQKSILDYMEAEIRWYAMHLVE